jgi:uncharacterized protein (UPF0335 family)
MTQTKYPISKIRSGEVAVKLTSIEQFKKIAPEQDNEQEAFSPNFYHVYERKQKYVPELELYWITKRECNLYTLIDFPQIDWEEKEEVVKTSNFFQLLDEYAKNQLAALKSENERLKEENERLKAENEEVYRQLKLREFPNPSQNQELSLRQRMAWEIYVSGFNHGIADKWTIAECYRSANIFLNYKGGDDEQ